MIRKIINNQERFFYKVPKEYVLCDYKDKKANISNLFLMVYCALDKWKNCQNLYRGSLSRLAFDCGIFKPLTKRTNYMAQKIITIMDYMQENNIFTIIEGDYHNLDDDFILQINEKEFEDKRSYVLLEDRLFDYILTCNSLIKKSNLLQVLLYVLSPRIECKTVDKDTGEITRIYFQVFSESVHNIAKRLGLSDNTIKGSLAVLSDKYATNGKPLIVRQHKGYVKNGTYHRFPCIYTENSIGWESRIKAELSYYDRLVEKRLSEINE